MIIKIDTAIQSFSNFNGYVGNPPTNEEEFNNLQPFTLNFNSVWSGTPPTWQEVLNKQAELQSIEDTKCNNKVSAYRKLSMTDDEILAIDRELESYL